MKIVILLILSICGFLYGSTVMAAKCMLVMSYHQGYAWNDGVQRGVESILKNKCDLQIFYMDTKKNKTKAHAKEMAVKAKKAITNFKPDVLIASDDNASRYLISKYYKDAQLPVVFCAVNWDVSKYGYPYKNVTGMIEIAPIQPLIEVSRKILGKMKAMVYLGAKTFTEKKNAKRVIDVVSKQGITAEVLLAETTKDWKEKFIQSQTADFVIVGSNAGIKAWNNKEMAGFVSQHARKLIVTNHDWMTPYAMFAMTKVAEEQGEWAAEAALAILKGMSPTKIPIRVNRKWQTYINTPLLQKAGLSIETKNFKNLIEVGEQHKTN